MEKIQEVKKEDKKVVEVKVEVKNEDINLPEL